MVAQAVAHDLGVAADDPKAHAALFKSSIRRGLFDCFATWCEEGTASGACCCLQGWAPHVLLLLIVFTIAGASAGECSSLHFGMSQVPVVLIMSTSTLADV